MARTPRLQTPMRADLDEVRGQLLHALDDVPLDPRRSYAEQVHDLLRDAIVRGRLLPGTTLSEAAIAAAIGVSRTPVREALRLLAQEELVLVYPQAGTVVAPVRLALIHEGRFVRRALECANLAELVSTITPLQIDEIQGLLAAQREAVRAEQPDEFFRLDETMHRRLFEFTGRGRVWTLVEGVKLHLDRVRWLLLDRIAEHAERALREHTAIVECLAAHDAGALAAAMHQHIDAVTRHLLDLRDRAPEGFFSD